jgi:hypothetical protein
MDPRLAFPVVLTALVALGACAAPGAEVERLVPLVVHEEREAAYSAELGLAREAGHDRAGEARAEMAPAPPSAVDEGAPADAAPLIVVGIRIARLSPAEAERLLGWKAGKARTIRVDREAVERTLAELGGRIVSAPRLVVLEGVSASFSIKNDAAFVGGFSLEQRSDGTIVDPVVEVVREGYLLDLVARFASARSEDAVELELDFEQCDLQRPFPASQVRVPGGPTEVTIEQPVAVRQHLAGGGSLGAEECLVLGALAGSVPGELHFVFVTARRATDLDRDAAG